MVSFGLICVGSNSEEFTLHVCQTCREHRAQDNVLFVGVYPISDGSKKTVKTLRDMGIRAATVEKRNDKQADIYALTALFQAFNNINVAIPDLVLLVLDQELIRDPGLMTQSWQTISAFKEEHSNTEVIAVYFTQEDRNTTMLDQIKALVATSMSSNAFTAPLAHALLISENASLWKKFGRQYREILARDLAVLLITEECSTVSVPFRKQVQRIKSPLVGMALDEVETPQIWRGAATLRGQLPTKDLEDAARSLVEASVHLLNNVPAPLTSFGEISPEARKDGGKMLAVNLLTPPIQNRDREDLDKAVGAKLRASSVDAQGLVVAMPQSPQTYPMSPTLNLISYSTLPLVKVNAVRNRVPVINRLPITHAGQKKCQILVLFGIEDSHAP